jgi:SAM-dependent methyltransferase
MPAVTSNDAADGRMWARFFELYEALPRGGPGDPESARRALSLMTGLSAHPRILDLGCGPGRGSVALAELTGGHVTAFDLHLPFVTGQSLAARRERLADCVLPVCADMGAAPFAEASFDLVWSEGALYSIGFRNGLDACRRLAKPGGYIAVTEAVWLVPDPPEEIHRWWTAEYPDIASIEEKAAVVASAGFDMVGRFTLPPAAWREHYYAPLRERAAALRQAWANDDAGRAVLAQVDTEIAMCERWGHTYGYEFFVARRAAAAS